MFGWVRALRGVPTSWTLHPLSGLLPGIVPFLGFLLLRLIVQRLVHHLLPMSATAVAETCTGTAHLPTLLATPALLLVGCEHDSVDEGRVGRVMSTESGSQVNQLGLTKVNHPSPVKEPLPTRSSSFSPGRTPLSRQNDGRQRTRQRREEPKAKRLFSSTSK